MLRQPTTLRVMLTLLVIFIAGTATALALKPQSVSNRIEQGDHTLGGDFQLHANTGPVSLKNFPDKIKVIYFGYASCPDVCPTALAVLSQAIRNLPPAQQNEIQGIFISVDPDRDDVEKLAKYSSFFSPHLIGVTGSKAEIDQVVQQYGAFYRKVELKDSAMKYAVDHSSYLYFIDRQNNLVKTLPHITQPGAIEAQLESMLQ